MFFGDSDQQASGGLGIEKDIKEVRPDGRIDQELVLKEGPVGVGAGRMMPISPCSGFREIGAWRRRQAPWRRAAGAHLISMSQKPKAVTSVQLFTE